MKITSNFLLNYCQDKPELYNKVANELWIQFGLRSAELNLLCTFIANERSKEVIQEVADMYRNSKYPEDLECDIADWLNCKGVKI